MGGRMTRFGLVTGIALAACGPAVAQPREVLIVRHAEKPDGDSAHLSAEGSKRAEALPRLFDAARADALPRPDFIIATRASNHSNRPVETVTPLARRFKLAIDDRYANNDYPKLAAELLSNQQYAGK